MTDQEKNSAALPAIMELSTVLMDLDAVIRVIRDGMHICMDKLQSIELQISKINEIFDKNINPIPKVLKESTTISPRLAKLIFQADPLSDEDKAFVNYSFDHISQLSYDDARAVLSLRIRCER